MSEINLIMIMNPFVCFNSHWPFDEDAFGFESMQTGKGDSFHKNVICDKVVKIVFVL